MRLAQMRDAGKQFGDFEKPAPNAKLLPRMNASFAREILRYWYAASETALVGMKAKAGPSLIRLTKAVDRYRAAMEPFAASVLIDLPLGEQQSLLLTYEASLKFWDATQALSTAMAATSWAPDKTDLWWQSVAESAQDLGKKAVAIVETGASALVVGLVVVGALLLSNNRKEKRG